MALVSETNLSLHALAKRMNPDGTIADIIELMSQYNPIVDHAVAIEGNLPTGHRFTVRTGLPTVSARSIGQGSSPSKSTTTQVDEFCTLLEARSYVDAKLATLSGNVAKFRFSEDVAFIEAMNQKVAELLFRGNPSTDPRFFRGLEYRYVNTSHDNGDQIIKVGTHSGSDSTSLWYTVWSEQGVFFITPKGSDAGLVMRDLGEEAVEDGITTGAQYQALRTLFQWDLGLGIKDQRQVARIQFDKSTVAAGTDTAQTIVEAAFDGYDRLAAPGAGRVVGYCGRFLYSKLRNAALQRVASSTLTIEKIEGRPPLLQLAGIPIYACDQIGITETAVATS